MDIDSEQEIGELSSNLRFVMFTYMQILLGKAMTSSLLAPPMGFE